MLRFNDGVDIDASGWPRVLKLPDGYYAVGFGILEPCVSEKEAETVVKGMIQEADPEAKFDDD